MATEIKPRFLFWDGKQIIPVGNDLDAWEEVVKPYIGFPCIDLAFFDNGVPNPHHISSAYGYYKHVEEKNFVIWCSKKYEDFPSEFKLQLALEYL